MVPNMGCRFTGDEDRYPWGEWPIIMPHTGSRSEFLVSDWYYDSGRFRMLGEEGPRWKRLLTGNGSLWEVL